MREPAPTLLAPEPGLVSIIVPVFNRTAFLVEAVESALAQESAPVEVILVDDASNDATLAAIRELVAKHAGRVRAIHHRENRGPGASRESGRLAARGEFLQFLDSDDLLLPGKLERQVASLRAVPEAGVAYGWTRVLGGDGLRAGRPARRSGERFETLFPALLAGRIWITATPLYRAEVCAAAGGWSSLRLDEDWEFEARVAARGTRLAYSEGFVAEHRTHGGEHAGTLDRREPWRLSDRAAALLSVLDSANAAGVAASAPEMARFARTLFHLARRCGAVGLSAEARSLFAAARAASTPERARGLDFRIVGALAATLGWRLTSRIARRFDGLRVARRTGDGMESTPR